MSSIRTKERVMEQSEVEVRPFRFHVPAEELVDLQRRIAATRWPDRETVTDQSQGVQLATMKDLARYWSTNYDFGRLEAKLNALPNFITEIDGLDIHFLHVCSKHENALLLIVTHGWPGSIVEQLKIIDPLTNPTAYGGHRTRSMLSFRRCQATGFQASRQRPAGIPSASLARGSC